MMSKVKDIAARYETLGELLSSPETAADPARWAAYSKERASLEEIALQYYECERTKKEMEAAFSEAEKETGEMKELLLEEGYVLKEKLSTLENELKVLLLPKDEKDDRGCTLEIRAGAGARKRRSLPMSSTACIRGTAKSTASASNPSISTKRSSAV